MFILFCAVAPGQIANGHANIDTLVFQLEEIQATRQKLGKYVACTESGVVVPAQTGL